MQADALQQPSPSATSTKVEARPPRRDAARRTAAEAGQSPPLRADRRQRPPKGNPPAGHSPSQRSPRLPGRLSALSATQTRRGPARPCPARPASAPASSSGPLRALRSRPGHNRPAEHAPNGRQPLLPARASRPLAEMRGARAHDWPTQRLRAPAPPTSPQERPRPSPRAASGSERGAADAWLPVRLFDLLAAERLSA